ncbi:MAG: L,D-transpeptidase family protein [Oscillospiraceae bacterium]|nr:L,D-transpeptidase family protein [Oscillospiraceae bacterium]
MKKFRILCLAVALALCMLAVLTGCGKTSEETFSPAQQDTFLAGTTINGQDVSLLTAEEALTYLQEQAEHYTLSLKLGDNAPLKLTAADLGLQVNVEQKAVADLLEEQAAHITQLDYTIDGLYTVDLSALQTKLEALNTQLKEESEAKIAQARAEQLALEAEEGAEPEELTAEDEEDALPDEIVEIPDPYAAQDAELAFDPSTNSFVILPDTYAQYVNAAAVLARADEAVHALQTELKLEPEDYAETAARRADDPALEDALQDANEYLSIDLSYTFTPKGAETRTETLSREVLGGLYMVGLDGLSVEVDEEALGSYVNALADTYRGESSTTPFKTTGGSTININVTSAGQSVDDQALYADMLSCLTDKVSGTREAPYATADDDSKGFWGGNYVELDLTNQHLWCYHNGECVVSCAVVTGCVANGTLTPTGCFTIFSKDYDRYLRGFNADGTRYNSHVWYFMPFSGGCGIHDAAWRSSFGGDIYLYNGSKGCVNVTKSQAKTIYNNVSIGTHVVVYGGRTSVEPLAQNLSATAPELTVGGTGKITLKGDQTTPTYSSSDSGVVKVDESGNLTAVAAGTATITVKCPSSQKYLEGTTTVTVTVKAAEQQPTQEQPTQEQPTQEQPAQQQPAQPEQPAQHEHNWVPITSTVHHDAVIEEVTVVDQEAYDEPATYEVNGVVYGS